jgi:hypothetical protein
MIARPLRDDECQQETNGMAAKLRTLGSVGLRFITN